MSDDKTTVDLSGAQLNIDGQVHYVESGELVVRTDYLRDIRGEPQGVLDRTMKIDVELLEPENALGGE